MVPSIAPNAPLALLKYDKIPATSAPEELLAPEQDLTLCFVCLRWTTDAPECDGTFRGCDLQPGLPRA